MTIEHFLFIPSIFLLGFFFGAMIEQRNRVIIDKGDPNYLHSVSIYAIVISFLIFISIFVATHMMPLFGGSKFLSTTLNGKSLFDQRPSFTGNEVYLRISEFSQFGREMYMRFTYTVDLVFPLAFLGFLLLLTLFIGERSTLSKSIVKKLMLLPGIWFFSDMIENIIVYSILLNFPAKNEFLSSILGFVTTLKFILLLLSLSAPAIVSVLFKKRRL